MPAEIGSIDPAGSTVIDGHGAELFAAAFDGRPLDINAVVQRLIGDGHVKTKAKADADTTVAGHQLGRLLSMIDFDLLANEARRKMESKEPLPFWAVFLLVLGVLFCLTSPGILLLVVRYVGLHALGFTTHGVAAGSVAAAWQSTLGNVAAGSLFALLQSIGAGGFGGVCGVVAYAAAGLGAAFAQLGLF